MSLSTLLEAAKYLDYLDSNNHQQQNQQNQQQSSHQAQQPHPSSHLQFQAHQPQQIFKKSRRQRSSKRSAANTMLAMSLPVSTGPLQAHGMPIPLVSGGDNQQTASLSSSFTTGSPMSSSFASTALFCSKASGLTSAPSSAASSLSSSDSSSSCGEILMGDNDFNSQPTQGGSGGGKRRTTYNKANNNNNHHDYHITHQQFETNHQMGTQAPSMHQYGDGNNNLSVARYIAATSNGPQLVTLTSTSATASSSGSALTEGSLRAGHVIHAHPSNRALLNNSPGSSFDPRHSPLTNADLYRQQQALNARHDGQHKFNLTAAGSFGSDNHLSGSPSSCPPLIMARVQPMILNSLSPSAQSIMAFQSATASSPTSSSSSYSRHRELHKTLEKNRRAHLRHCFELLKAELPVSECVDKKTSHINIIKSAIRYVLALRQQECEIDNELQRLTKIKSELTENLSKLRNNKNNNNQTQDQQVSTLTSEPQSGQEQQSQQPASEQQLSFLLSQSKID